MFDGCVCRKRKRKKKETKRLFERKVKKVCIGRASPFRDGKDN